MSLFAYEAHKAVTTSEHMPVSAAFDLTYQSVPPGAACMPGLINDDTDTDQSCVVCWDVQHALISWVGSRWRCQR